MPEQEYSLVLNVNTVPVTVKSAASGGAAGSVRRCALSTMCSRIFTQ
jgi:hypothetical protein